MKLTIIFPNHPISPIQHYVKHILLYCNHCYRIIFSGIILYNNISNLLLTPYFSKISNEYEKSLRNIVIFGIKYGIPIPAFASAISYYDSYRANSLPANLIQAQRDYFGAHTYKRIDKMGYFHTDWLMKK